MKLILIACALVAVVSADWAVKSSSETANIRKACLKENPLSTETLDQLKAWNYPEEDSVRNYLLCLTTKMGLWDSENGLILDRMVAQFKSDLDESEVTSIVRKCIDDNKTSGKAESWLIPIQRCIISSKIGDKIKAYVKKQKQ